MRVSRHLAISTALSAAAAVGGAPVDAVVASFAGGWLIDFDHLLDYAVEHRLRPDPKFFFRTFSEHLYRRARIVLHGWEWPVAAAIAGIVLGGNTLLLGLAFGWFQHLVFDQITNGPTPGSYSLLWRLWHGFDYGTAFPAKNSPK
jgi:hypothetical protein